MLGSAQVRACFAEKTVLCGKDSWLNAQVRTGPRQIGLMLGFAAPRRFCRDTGTVLRAGSWAKCSQNARKQ